MNIVSSAVKLSAAMALSLLLVNCGGESGGISIGKNTNAPVTTGGGGGGTTPESNTSRAQAITFLKQAAIATKESDIDFVMKHGYEAWIDRQFTLSYDANSAMLTRLYKEMSIYNSTDYQPSMAHPTDGNSCDNNPDPKKAAYTILSLWWQRAFEGDDQLRQKIAYALSQIIVVSGNSPAGNLLSWRGEALAYYYDILLKNAFADYKTLLRDITSSPAMAYYMTYIGSAKYDAVKGNSPDENYAREIMQMFSIGTSELNLDGSVKKTSGHDIPTYTQNDVMENARAFSGWSLQGSKFGKLRKSKGCYILPIQFYPEYHDNGEKHTLGSTVPSGQTGRQDIESILTILMGNKNIAPFISKKLIQRMTTSNPSPAYIQRVASVFNDNGHGVKGDLKAVVKAILLDKEVRNGTNPHPGRYDELLTATAHLFSMFGAKPSYLANGALPDTHPIYWINTKGAFSQAVLSAPDVFNFYDADYAPSDPLFNGLVAPEVQIQTPTNLIRYSNFLYIFFRSYDRYAKTRILHDSTVDKKQPVSLDLTDVYEAFEKALDGDTDASFSNLKDAQALDRGLNALVEYLNDKMLGGTLPDDYKNEIIASIKTNAKIGKDLPKAAREIVVTAIVAIATSPYYIVIK